MNVSKLCDVELRYTALESLDYDAGGQLYGTMDGRLAGARLSGAVRLTNLAARRPDNVNLPTLRGVLTTDDGAAIWIELDGIATLRETDGARVFVTSWRFRTGDPRYVWLNTTFGVLEGLLGRVAVGGMAVGELHVCTATITES